MDKRHLTAAAALAATPVLAQTPKPGTDDWAGPQPEAQGGFPSQGQNYLKRS